MNLMIIINIYWLDFITPILSSVYKNISTYKMRGMKIFLCIHYDNGLIFIRVIGIFQNIVIVFINSIKSILEVSFNSFMSSIKHAEKKRKRKFS